MWTSPTERLSVPCSKREEETSQSHHSGASVPQASASCGGRRAGEIPDRHDLTADSRGARPEQEHMLPLLFPCCLSPPREL